MKVGGTMARQLSLDDWLWRLDCVQEEWERLAPAHNLYALFALKTGESHTHSEKEWSTFPFGNPISMSGWNESYWIDPETGDFWFQIHSGSLPFVVCSGDLGLTSHDSMPEQGRRLSLGLARWYYLQDDIRKARRKTPCLTGIPDMRLLDLEYEALRLCELAPEVVLRNCGRLALLGHYPSWPTVLLYMAMKEFVGLVVPFLHPVSRTGPGVEEGRWKNGSWEGNGKPKLAWAFMNDWYITLEPDVATATRHVLDYLRHVAKAGDAKSAGGGEKHTETAFCVESGQVTYGGADLDLPTGLCLETMKNLVTKIGRVVPYTSMDANSKEGMASEQLRGVVRTIRRQLKARKVPFEVANKAREGYVLRPILKPPNGHF